MTSRQIDPITGADYVYGEIVHKYVKKAPVDIVGLAKELGVKVWESGKLPDNISGKLFKDRQNGGRSGFSIIVNAKESLYRKRFTVAHELAHFILHKNKLDEGEVTDDTLYRSDLSSEDEREANGLAAQILMPVELIKELKRSGFKDVESLAKVLQVSVPAIKARLGIPSV
jgi:Zn-dependent peptidase ImmA (M78 family)